MAGKVTVKTASDISSLRSALEAAEINFKEQKHKAREAKAAAKSAKKQLKRARKKLRKAEAATQAPSDDESSTDALPFETSEES